MELALGTAQFGLDYGINNAQGRVSEGQVEAILKTSYKRGIRIIDTAKLYGDSEKVIGDTCRRAGLRSDDFNFVTKISSRYRKDGTMLHPADQILDSLVKLTGGRENGPVYGVLAHYPGDLLGPVGADIAAALKKAKKAELCQKIGFSAYTSSEAEALMKIFHPDIIQIPANIFDQRIIRSGVLSKLRKEGTEIHIRSAFLQGLIMMPLTKVPPFFSPLKKRIGKLQKSAEKSGCSIPQLCLDYLYRNQAGDVVVLGVDSLEQLNSNVTDFAKIQNLPEEIVNYQDFAVEDEKYLDPSKWQV